MNAILLCAGFGTRLQPLTDDTPKALVPVAGRPILDYLVEQLADWPQLETIHIVHNDRHPGAFARWQASWAHRSDIPDVRLHNNGVQTDAQRRGAVGDLQFALDRVGTDAPAVVAAGDSLYRIALRPVLDRFQITEAHCVLALPVSDEQELRHSSVFDLDGDRVQGVEHTPGAPPSHWVSPAFYALQRTGLDHVAHYLDRGGDADTLGRFIHNLTQHQPVEAVRVTAPSAADGADLRFHINTPDEHARAEAILADASVLLDDETRN
jgi:NDP-sugar pyrophosphorylase family protein